jgi:hypothetical protein
MATSHRWILFAAAILAIGLITSAADVASAQDELAGSGGKGTLSVNGKKVAEGRIEKTVSFLFSADETADVGMDNATPVTKEYKKNDNKFTGKISKVTVELK